MTTSQQTGMFAWQEMVVCNITRYQCGLAEDLVVLKGLSPHSFSIPGTWWEMS